MGINVQLSTALLIVVALVTGCIRSTPKPAFQGAYRVVRDVALPGGTSRWDYQSYDARSHRLYLSHLGASEIVVFDTAEQRVVGIVGGVRSVHGLALAPDLDRLFAAATGDDRVVAIDLTTLKVVGSAPTGDYPDGIAYAPTSHSIFVSNEHDTGDTVIDARTLEPLGEIRLGGDIGNSQFDAARGVVWVAVGTTNVLAEVDPERRVVVERHRLEGCTGAHGIQVDVASRRRVFVACEGNATLVVVDLEAKRVTQRFDVGNGPDVLALDEGKGRLYVAAESGQLAAFDVSGSSVRKLWQDEVGPDAHSVAVDPDTHLVYLPLTDVAGHPVLRELQER